MRDSPARVRAAIAALPTGAFAMLLVAWSLGALAGASVAAVMARGRPRRAALIVGAVLLAATIANLVMIPHPAWVSVLGPLLIVSVTIAVIRVAGSRPA